MGLTTEFVEKGLILGTKPGDAKALGEAIDYLLSNPEFARKMAEQAHSYFLSCHTSEHYVNQICRQMEKVNALDKGISSPVSLNSRVSA